VTCLRLIWDEPSVQDQCWAEGGWSLAQMRWPMCTEHGIQRSECNCYFLMIKHIDVYLHHCQPLLMHVYRARWTDGGLPPAYLGRAVCQRLLLGRGWLAFGSCEVTHVYIARWTDGGLPPTLLGRAVYPKPLLGQRVVGLWLKWGYPIMIEQLECCENINGAIILDGIVIARNDFRKKHCTHW
jgi:hypothetical protein